MTRIREEEEESITVHLSCFTVVFAIIMKYSVTRSSLSFVLVSTRNWLCDFVGDLVRTERATQPVLMLCNVSSYVAYNPTESGFVVSPNFPSSVPHTGGSLLSCELKITACARCRIRLNFDGLQRSWLSRCESSLDDGSTGCRHGWAAALLLCDVYADVSQDVCLSVHLSICHTPVFFQNDQRYLETFSPSVATPI